MNAIRPEARAHQLRSDLGIAGRTFDLVALIEDMGIRIEYATLQHEGLSFRFEQQDLIVIDPGQRNLAGQRFTLAHELGHHLLGHTTNNESWGASEGAPGTKQEQEANQFASALLMPKQLFKADMKTTPTNWEGIERLAQLYEVSLTAAAIRFVSLTDDYCAVIGLRRTPEKHWSVKSRPVEKWWLKLPPDDDAIAMNLTTTAASGEVRAGAWIEHLDDQIIHESTRQIAADHYVALLTNLPDPDDDTGWEEAAADQERQERRQRFSRY
jgi:Zn-dependent peptidase ImmA (M78 family)